jgi:hypothetical protein
MKKTLVGLFVCILLLATSIPLSVSSNETTNRTIYVDDDNTEGPWDGSMEHPYRYIQDGIDASEGGDTVYVYSGIYYENIIVDKSINLVGEDRDTTIVDGGGSGDVVYVSADDVCINGFTVQNSGNIRESNQNDFGIEIDSNSIILSNNIISNNNGLAGVSLDGDSHIVSDNLITFNDMYGMTIGDSDHNNISNNFISYNTFAGLGVFGSHHVISGNTIINHGSLINQTMGFGVMTVLCSDCLVSSNNFSDNFPFGLYFFCTPNSHNTITWNNFIRNLAGFGTVLFQGLPSSVDIEHELSRFQPNFCNLMKKIRCLSSMNHPWILLKKFGHFPDSTGFISGCIWDANYWYGWDGTGPEIVYGAIMISLCIPIPIPWLNFDWHPAREPYDIP